MADTTTAPIEIEVQVPRYLQNIRERKSCFQRSPLRERCLTSFFGLLGGFALGIVVAFALDANTQDAFMPLIIHRAIYISLLPGLIGFFGLTCGFGVVEVCCCGCRTGFPERCSGKACSICCGLLWALPFALTSILVGGRRATSTVRRAPLLCPVPVIPVFRFIFEIFISHKRGEY